MPIVDQSIQIQSTPENIANAIRKSANGGQVITPKGTPLYIVLEGDVGYVYLLRPGNDDNTRVRLLVDSAATVRNAFRGQSPKDALTTLVNTSFNGSESQQTKTLNEARQRLTSIKQSSEQPASASPSFADLYPDDDDTPGKKASSRQNAVNPWNPDQFFGYLFFITTIGVAIAFALNWRRLGKKQWFLPALGVALLPILLIIILFVFSQSIAPGLLTALLLLLVAGNFAGLIVSWQLQRGAYKTWVETNDLSDYRYNFGKAFLTGVVALVLVSAFVGVLFTINTRPNNLVHQDVNITYSSTWAVESPSQIPNCNDGDFECILVLYDARFGFTTMMFGKYTEQTDRTAEQIERQWRGFMEDEYGMVLQSTDTLTFAGVPGTAARRFYTLPPLEGDNDLRYAMQIYIVRDKFIYELTVQSLNQPIFEEKRAAIDAFIQGIVFNAQL